jgi:hypothetical protein
MMRVVLAAVLCFFVVGCGYRTLSAPEGTDIILEMPENRSSFPGVEKMMQDALQEEFARRGEVTPRYLRGSGQKPSLVLSGVIRDVVVRHSALSTVGLALEDEIEVVVDMQVARPSDGRVIWRRTGWREEESFTTSSDAQVYETNRTQALRRLAASYAERVHDELLQSL